MFAALYNPAVQKTKYYQISATLITVISYIYVLKWFPTVFTCDLAQELQLVCSPDGKTVFALLKTNPAWKAHSRPGAG